MTLSKPALSRSLSTASYNFYILLAERKKQDGNGPDILPDQVYQAVLNDQRAYTTGGSYLEMTKEKILAALGSSAKCGIGLYQTSPGGTKFTKVN
jgi:hypothetical protein